MLRCCEDAETKLPETLLNDFTSQNRQIVSHKDCETVQVSYVFLELPNDRKKVDFHCLKLKNSKWRFSTIAMTDNPNCGYTNGTALHFSINMSLVPLKSSDCILLT